MWVELGNDTAIEGYTDPNAEDPDKTLFRPAPGERITTITFPPDKPLGEAFLDVTRMADHLFTKDEDSPHGHTLPTWIESDSPGLKALLAEHFGLTKDSQQYRPKAWGKEFGLHEDEDLPSARLYAEQGGHPLDRKRSKGDAE